MNDCCKNCVYKETVPENIYDWFCNNPDSVYYMQVVEYTKSCDEYKEKDE